MSPLLLQVAGTPPGLTSDHVAGQAGSLDAAPADESETSVPPASKFPHLAPDTSALWWQPKLPAIAHNSTRPRHRGAASTPLTAPAERTGLVTPRKIPPR